MFKKRGKTTAAGAASEKLTWYQRFGLFFFTRVRVTLLLWVLLASFGAAAYSTLLQREGFPDVSAPYSTVSGTYFVGDKEQVDEEIAQPMAETILEVDGVNQVFSRASDNGFGLQIEFEESVKPDEGNARVERAVTEAGILPEAAEAQFSPLFVSKLTPEGDDVLISVSSPSLGTQALQEQADAVAAVLSSGGAYAIDGAERVRVLDAFRRGTDPATGQAVLEQQNFDWIAVPDASGEVAFANSTLVAVQATPGTDILDLDNNITETLARLNNDPAFADVSAHVAADFATSVRAQIDSLQSNLLGGLLVVILVSFLLISLRASLIAAFTMVTVLAVAVGLLYLFGLTLNVITLFALILSLGLIVDDAIIVTEAIDKAQRSGLKARTAVATALKKIALASVAGTLTTMLGFAPLLFVGGIIGDFIRAIPITIIISLAVSLVVSMSLIPFLSRFLLLRGKVQPLRNPIARFEARGGQVLGQLVRRSVRSRKQGALIGLAAIAVSIGTIFGGMFYAGKLQFNIFPQTEDGNVLVAELSFENGSIEEAGQISREVNERIASGLEGYIERVSYQGSGSADSARVVIDLVPYQERDVSATELANSLSPQLDDVAGVSARVDVQGAGPPSGGFTMQIRTEQSEAATELAQSIQSFLQDHTIERPDGTTAAFTEVTVSGDRSVERVNGERYVEVGGSYNADDISALVVLTQDAIKAAYPPERLQDEFGLPEDALVFDVGQEAQNQESFQSMVIAFPILLIAMYILLAVQFRSLSQPLMIFLAVPFSLFGVTAGLYFTDNPFSFFTMLAVFALLGISVNNTILLTAYANQARKAGMGRIDAMASALEERFRPLLATSLTTVAALVPLALSDPFWESLAVSLIFGLLSSTFLVIIAFPYYYLANELIRVRFGRRRVLPWLITLVAGSVLVGFVASGLLGLFIMAYLAVTFILIAVQAFRRRRAG
jgi:multidrug efflux pump subunit AcrB